MIVESDIHTWSDEWKRTRPDYAVYLPETENGPDADNEHFLVFHAPKSDDLIAIWTQGDSEGGSGQHIACARSSDNGNRWTKPVVIDGPRNGDGAIASWGFPLVSRRGRIYCMYIKFVGIIDTDRQTTGPLTCRYSDDDGHTWSEPSEIPVRRRGRDNPDRRIPTSLIVWQKPIRDSKGRLIVGFTRHTSSAVRPVPYGAWQADTQCELMRFENLDENPHPDDLAITWLPDIEGRLRVGVPGRPDISVCQEPSLVLLPDKRLFCVFRTLTGRIYYSVSADDGHTWRDLEPLRYEDGGAEVLQPICSCPVYAMQDGRYLLLYHNNDGRVFGRSWCGDSDYNRHPAFIALGEYREEAHQPIWFSPPKQFCDSDGIALGPAANGGRQLKSAFRVEVATYPSYTEQAGKRVIWYPDRKHFLLGREIDDSWLSDMRVPEGPSIYYPSVRKVDGRLSWQL